MTTIKRPDRCLLCEARLSNPVCQLPAQVVDRLSALTAISALEGGTTIFRQGEPCPDIFIIRSGQVKLTFEHSDGAEQLLRLAGPGETIGLSRASERGMPVTAVTKGSVSLCRARRADIERLVTTDPDFALAWGHLLLDEVTRAREAVFNLGPQPAGIRLARFLHQTVKNQPRNNASRQPNSVPMTHAELASALSVAQETITRLLRDLEERQVVRLARGRIEVLDTERLDALAGHEDAAQAVGRID